MRSLLILFAIRLSSRFLRGLRSVFSVRVAIQSRDFCWHVLTRFFMFGFLRLTSCLNWFCLNVNHVRRLWKLNFNFQYLFLFGLFACWCYHAQGKIFEESCQSKNIELFNKPRIVQTWMNIWSAISSTRKGRVGRELFEFEELWFSFSWSHFVFSHPNSLIPPWGKEQTTLVELWPLKPKDMSTHLTLSEGRENLRLRKLSTGLDNFSPDKSLKKKESDCCPIDLVACPNFFTDVAAWFFFLKISIWLASENVSQMESLVRLIRQRDLWFLSELLYMILTIACIYVI